MVSLIALLGACMDWSPVYTHAAVGDAQPPATVVCEQDLGGSGELVPLAEPIRAGLSTQHVLRPLLRFHAANKAVQKLVATMCFRNQPMSLEVGKTEVEGGR